MYSLLLHVVFASAFTLLLKWAQMRVRENVITIGAINYIVAAVVALPVFLIYNPRPAIFGAIWTGGGMGTLYFIAFFFVIYAIKKVGASSTTVVSVLSISMPIAFAAMFFDEVPNALQITGIVLAMASLALISGNRSPETVHADQRKGVNNKSLENVQPAKHTVLTTPVWVVPTVLIVFFLLCGFNRMLQDAFKHYGAENHRPAFLLAGFTMAAIPSIVLLIYNRRLPSGMEFAFGIVIGLSNLLQTFFILRALQKLDGYVVFTLASAGAIVLTTLVATTMLGERLNRRTQIGITMSVASLFLLFN